jgi:hypothetical protein
MARQDDGRLDDLFSRLKLTSDVQEARLIEGLIWTLWFESGHASRELLNVTRHSQKAGADVRHSIT